MLKLIALWKAGKNEVLISTEWNIAVLTAKRIDPTIFQIVAIVPSAAPILEGAMTWLTAVIIAALLNPQRDLNSDIQELLVNLIFLRFRSFFPQNRNKFKKHYSEAL